jgi:hypothetical protein
LDSTAAAFASATLRLVPYISAFSQLNLSIFEVCQ